MSAAVGRAVGKVVLGFVAVCVVLAFVPELWRIARPRRRASV